MELRHADRVASKMIELGGRAEWRFLPFESSDSLRDVLQRHALNEAKAIKLYDEILTFFDYADFKLILKGIKEEEKEHLQKVEHILKHLKR